MRYIVHIAAVVAVAAGLSACARSEAIRTSGNTVLIQTSAAPICGGQGAARVAATTAAIETIRAGYDRYVITGGASANNVTSTELPGTARTSGSLSYGGGYGTYRSQTTYTPGPTIVSGTHDQGLSVHMFRNGEPGSDNAIPARETLGPEWAEKVKSGQNTCLR